MPFIASILLFAFLYVFLELVIRGSKPPVAKTKQDLYKFVRYIGKQAAKEGRSQLNKNDRLQILSYSGAKDWQDLDVLTIHEHFKNSNREFLK